MKREGILVVDYGSQLAQTIARKCRQLGYYSEIVNPGEVSAEDLKNARGVIGSGGPASVYEVESPKPSNALINHSLPQLDICYSFQLYAYLNGGETIPSNRAGEYGKSSLEVLIECPIFDGLPSEQVVWMSHGDRVSRLPYGMRAAGRTKDCEYAAAWDAEKNRFGVQFHPEVDDTEYGLRIIKNFLELCGKPETPWSYEVFVRDAVSHIKSYVKNRKVVHLTSGGKDSTLAAILIKMAGINADFVHIDCGIGRKGEVEKVIRDLRTVGVEPVVLDTSSELEKELVGVTDAEVKRRIIGRHYIRVAVNYAESNYGSKWVIGQGTIYPDHIESQGTKHSARIKTHHNRVPEVLELIPLQKLLEPNLYLFKDDVEGVAASLAVKRGLAGLKNIFEPKHPFPGPGLAIRCLCSNGEFQDLNLLNNELRSIVRNHDYSALVLPVRTVGVQGDARTYAPPVVVWGEFNWEKLERVSIEITNKLRGRVNRVVYACSPKNISHIELMKSFITKERLNLLREADDAVMKSLENKSYLYNIKQCPTISVPLRVNHGVGESIVVRPFVTKDFMTGSFARLPGELVNDISDKILGLGYSAVFYDVSNKPPGTTEWE